jgi:hypothetical protein
VEGGGAGNIAAVQAQVGAPVIGAQGAELGTVASADAQGNIQLATNEGNVALAPGLVSNTNGQLTAPSVSPKDVMAMAATQQGDQAAARQASQRNTRVRRYRSVTGAGERAQTSAPVQETAPAPAAQQPAPADQPAPPADTQQPGQAQQPAQPETPAPEQAPPTQ